MDKGNCFFSATTLNKIAPVLDTSYHNACTGFEVIMATTEVSVYKILNYFIKKGMKESWYKIIDPQLVDSYITLTNSDYGNKKQIDELFEEVLPDVQDIWIVIPNITCRWTRRTALLFINKLKTKGCAGLLFYSSGKDNLGSVLIKQTNWSVKQLPIQQILHDTPKLVDDGF